MTDRGLARLRQASPTHLRGISEHFLAVVDDEDLGVIERCMTAVARQAGPDAGDLPALDAADPSAPDNR